MKKLLIPIVFILLLLASLLIVRTLNHYNPQGETETLSVVDSEIPSNPVCYQYVSVSTESEPYAVTETIILTKRTETVLEGTKQGTQSGPDMTNGYQGTLSGIISGTEASVLFSYLIEGASGKEQELYRLEENQLVKQVYPLLERGNLLIPDESSEKTDRVYTQIVCE